MPEKWYYADGNENWIGPLSFGELKELAAEGIVEPYTLLKNEDFSDSDAPMTAEQVEGLVFLYSNGMSEDLADGVEGLSRIEEEECPACGRLTAVAEENRESNFEYKLRIAADSLFFISLFPIIIGLILLVLAILGDSAKFIPGITTIAVAWTIIFGGVIPVHILRLLHKIARLLEKKGE